jgi:hypothetical protein
VCQSNKCQSSGAIFTESEERQVLGDMCNILKVMKIRNERVDAHQAIIAVLLVVYLSGNPIRTCDGKLGR